MRLTTRDIEVIEFIRKSQGATIDQVQKMFFKSYDTAKRRLKALEKMKELKSDIQPILGKKVYFIKKIPSYHRLIGTDIKLAFKDHLVKFKRNYDIENCEVDCYVVLKNGKTILFEIDIYNQTSKDKLEKMLRSLRKDGIAADSFVICKKQRRESWEIGIEDLENISRHYCK